VLILGTLGASIIRILIYSTMNKASIVDKVHEVLGGTKAQAERAVDTVIESITKALKGGQEVSIAGLGIFATKMRPARQGRNPRTGENINIPAMRVPKFRAGKALKDAVK
jgi:DNA-binding protein HU-beta